MQSIDELIELYKSILIAEKHLLYIDAELFNLKGQLGSLATAVDAIATTLEQPESFTIKGLFHKTLVNEDEQHELGKQEYLIAALKYKECIESIDLLEFERKIIVEKVADKTKVNAQLNMAFQVDLEKAKAYPQVQKRILEINKALTDLINYKRELYEAYQVGELVFKTLSELERELSNAQQYDNWGHFYNEIQRGKSYQRAYMDRAHNISHKANRQMLRLKKELDDIFQFKPNTSMATFDELLHFQDHFDDSLITDWIVENDVVVSMSRVISSKKYMSRILNSIKSYQKKSEKKLKQLKDSKEYIVANAEPLDS